MSFYLVQWFLTKMKHKFTPLLESVHFAWITSAFLLQTALPAAIWIGFVFRIIYCLTSEI
jgi:hypothetical protein